MVPNSLTTALMATVASLTTLAHGHMIMTLPVPFSKDTLDTSPLKNAKPGSDGSDYPCKLRANPYQISQMNNLTVGEEQTLAFGGSATHGGGTCQLSITLDEEPTVNSVFKIIQVFEGGCPLQNFTYSIPEKFPNGRATFAWTWYNLIGNREIYMNCAPITVSGGADSKDYFNSLPNQYLINLPTSECSSVEGTILQIPFPGDSTKVDQSDGKSLAAASGTGCAAAAAAQTQGISGGSSGNSTGGSSAGASSAAVSSQAPISTGVTSAAGLPQAPALTIAPILTVTTLATTTLAASLVNAPPPPSGMTTVASSAATAASASTMASSFPTLSPSTNAGVVPPAAASPTGSSAGASSGVGTNVGSGSGSGAASGGGSGTCTTNGAVMCNGQNQFGLCNFGTVVWQAVAAGTTCENGAIVKRSVGRNVHNRRYLRDDAMTAE